jgi:hypothetical protein
MDEFIAPVAACAVQSLTAGGGPSGVDICHCMDFGVVFHTFAVFPEKAVQIEAAPARIRTATSARLAARPQR